MTTANPHCRDRGMYFPKGFWDGRGIPDADSACSLLPEPVCPEEPAAVDAYWSGWLGALGSMNAPEPGSGLVSTHMGFVFNQTGPSAIFAHDSSIMTLFGRYGWRLFPFIETLDNFYARQHSTGEICREIDRHSGEDLWPNDEGDPMTVRLEGPWERHGGDWSKVATYTWHRPSIGVAPPSCCRVDGYTDHKFHWAEWEWYRLTGDRDRLSRVAEPLHRLYQAYSTYLQDRNGLYITDWAGMDNSPRNTYLGYGVDLSSQMAQFAATMAAIYTEIDRPEDAALYRDRALRQGALVRESLWNESTGLFHDRRFDGTHAPTKTVMGFAPLMGCRPRPDQVRRLVEHLNDPRTFGRPVPVPSLSADETEYHEDGDYYRGGVWPFTNAMVITGLEQCGEHELAGRIARRYWRAAVSVYRDTGTIWEYLSPEHPRPGRGTNPADPGKNARPDFTGWGAYPVISVFLEHGISLRADGPANRLVWNLSSTDRCGCRRFAFADVVTDLVVAPRSHPDAEPRLEEMETNRPYRLVLRWGNRRSSEQWVRP